MQLPYIAKSDLLGFNVGMVNVELSEVITLVKQHHSILRGVGDKAKTCNYIESK